MMKKHLEKRKHTSKYVQCRTIDNKYMYVVTLNNQGITDYKKISNKM